MQELAIGRRLCDAFRQVPPGSSPIFSEAVLELCRRERVDAVLPQSSHDLPALAEAKATFAERGVVVLVSSPEAIRVANDKAECYSLLDELGVHAPGWRRVRGGRELARAAAELRLPARAGLLQAGVELGLPRLPHSRSHGRSSSPAPARAPGQPPDAARGGHRAPARSRRRRAARHGAGRGRRANDRRHRRGRPRAARAPEDARVDAGRARDVLRDPPGRRPDGRRGPDRRRARARPLLQHPARRRRRHRGQPAHLHGRLPGGPESPVPGPQARARRDRRGGALRVCAPGADRHAARCATSTRWSGTTDGSGQARWAPSARAPAAAANAPAATSTITPPGARSP